MSYSAAKAGVNSFTQWLAVHLAQEYSPRIRVNAIAPGFFLTEQNRFLLTEQETGKLTARGQSIINHTPISTEALDRGRQIFGYNLVVDGEGDGTFDRAFQLAYISRPLIIDQ